MEALHFILYVLGCFSLCQGKTSQIDSIKNVDVKRTIDITSHIPKFNTVVKIENTGKTTINSYLFPLEAALTQHLSYISALVRYGEEETKLRIEKVTVSTKSDIIFYEITLDSGLLTGGSITLYIDSVFTHSLEPFPTEIRQADKQLVRFTAANLYYYTPYSTKTQTTIVNCASSRIESYSKSVKPVATSDNTITYGPYENVDAFSQGDLSIHYENNSPFLTITTLERVIEISHWGNIAVEESIDIIHSGATLKGSFSRYDYQRSTDGAASVKDFKTVLPSSSRDVYYRDEIGNISTSAMRELDDMVELELRPRFPLFGGWKTHYVLGYNVPSYQYLYNRGDQYALKMRFVDHVYDDQVIDHATVKVILPEGVGNIKLHAPYQVERDTDQKHSTYLDTSGRTVLVAHKTNLVEQHIQDFQVEYTFHRALLIREPLLVVAAFYLLFLSIIVYVRLDFSITKDEKSESRLRVASLAEQVQQVHGRRSALYQSYNDAINKFKASKDATSFETRCKKVDTDHKVLTNQIAGFATKIKSEAGDVADKITDLQKLDYTVREQVNISIAHAEKLVAGKLSKQQYLDYEKALDDKRTDLYRKMDDIISLL